MVSMAKIREQFDKGIGELRTFCSRLRESAAGPAQHARFKEAAGVRGRRGADTMRDLKDLAARELPSLPDGAYRSFLAGLLDESPSQHDARFDAVFGSGRSHNPLFESEDDEPAGDPVWGSGKDPVFGTASAPADPVFGSAVALPAADRSDYAWSRLQESARRPDASFDHLFAAAPTEATAVPAGSREMDCVFGTK